MLNQDIPGKVIYEYPQPATVINDDESDDGSRDLDEDDPDDGDDDSDEGYQLSASEMIAGLIITTPIIICLWRLAFSSIF